MKARSSAIKQGSSSKAKLSQQRRLHLVELQEVYEGGKHGALARCVSGGGDISHLCGKPGVLLYVLSPSLKV